METGYTLDAALFGEMFCFVAEHASGKRYRWYVHTENPTETFIQINAHMEAKAPPKLEAAVIPYVVQQAAKQDDYYMIRPPQLRPYWAQEGAARSAYG